MPMLVAAVEDKTLELEEYQDVFAEGCITLAANQWQAQAVNWHYQIPLSDFEGYNLVTVTANSTGKCYIAFFTERMTTRGAISYAQGWTKCLVMEPGTNQVLPIPEDAQYLYILNNNAAGDNLLPESVIFKAHEHVYEYVVTPPACTDGYTTHTCAICGQSYKDDYIEAPGHDYKGLACTVCGNTIQQIAEDVCVAVTPENYWTISNPDNEKLACGPGIVSYGDGNFAVAYLADDINNVETETSTTIVCRLGLFNIKDPENGQFYDIATAGKNIGDITIGSKAPYEPNLLKLHDSKLLILFNLHTTTGQYIYYGAIVDTTTKTVLTYQPLTLDGKDWTPANIAAAYNASEHSSVKGVKTHVVNFKPCERFIGNPLGNNTAGSHLGEISDTAEHTVGYSGRAAAALSYLGCSVRLYGNPENSGGALNDHLELLGRIEFKAQRNAKTVTERSCELA